jgi:hypothetical protein
MDVPSASLRPGSAGVGGLVEGRGWDGGTIVDERSLRERGAGHAVAQVERPDRRSAVPSAFSFPASGRLQDLIPRTYATDYPGVRCSTHNVPAM